MRTSIRNMISRRITMVACLAVAILAASADESLAQAKKKPTGYVLYRIMTTFVKPKQPHLIEAVPSGGKVNVDIKFHPTKCTESMQFTWKYDRDIRFLRPGETFNVTCTAGGSGNCDKGRYGFMIASGSEGSLFSGAKNKTLSKAELKEVGHKTIGTTRRLHNDTGPGGISETGTKTAKIEVWKHAYAKRIYHKVWFQSGSAVPGESMAIEIAYMYRAVYGPDPPRVSDDDVAMDNPGAGGTGSTGSTPGGNNGSNPGGNTGTNPGGNAGTTPGGNTGTNPGGNAGTNPGGNTGGGTGSGSGGNGTGTGSGTGTSGTGTGGTPPGAGVSGRTLKAEKRTVKPGDRVLVPVYLLNPDGVANVNFTVTYDPKVAVPDGDVVKGSLLGSARLESNSALQGTIRIGFAQKKGLAQNGIVAYLPFKAVGKAGDKTPLTLTVSDIDDASGNNLTIKLIHGEIKIASESLPGDCDGDGVLTVADAICALKMSVELMPVNMNLDVNNDGKVTSGDAREIMQRIP